MQFTFRGVTQLLTGQENGRLMVVFPARGAGVSGIYGVAGVAGVERCKTNISFIDETGKCIHVDGRQVIWWVL